MTAADTPIEAPQTPPPPPPATISFESNYGKNPLGEATLTAMCARLPSVLRQTAQMAWAIDRLAVILLLVCQVLTGVTAAVVLASTAQARQHLVGDEPVSERLHAALPALLIITAAVAVGRISSALSSYGDGRISPGLITAADTALVEAVCRVEASAYSEDGFANRQEAAEVGVSRTTVMVKDAQRFTAAFVRMIAASGVLTALHPLLLLLLAVVPAGLGAVLSARVDYETHYANVGDRNVRYLALSAARPGQAGDKRSGT
ncbi:hypothetical protein [Streptomyces mirabilis]|uniref:hypothetical protein n=1 Tax=Streptomyces mirabilis TaxID=68239 RepID=UPI0038212E95